MPIKSGKDQRLRTNTGGSAGGTASLLAGDQARDRQKVAQRHDIRMTEDQQEHQKETIGLQQEFQTGRDEAGFQRQTERDEAGFQQQQDMYQMKTDTEKMRTKEKRSEYESGVQQIEDAYAEGKINRDQYNQAMSNWNKRHSDVSDPNFADVTKEEGPTVDIGGGEQVPALLDSQGRPDPGKTKLEWAKIRGSQKEKQDKEKLKGFDERIKAELYDKGIDPNSTSAFEYKERRRKELLSGESLPVTAQAGAAREIGSPIFSEDERQAGFAPQEVTAGVPGAEQEALDPRSGEPSGPPGGFMPTPEKGSLNRQSITDLVNRKLPKGGAPWAKSVFSALDKFEKAKTNKEKSEAFATLERWMLIMNEREDEQRHPNPKTSGTMAKR